jgi:hypothetical protein
VLWGRADPTGEGTSPRVVAAAGVAGPKGGGHSGRTAGEGGILRVRRARTRYVRQDLYAAAQAVGGHVTGARACRGKGACRGNSPVHAEARGAEERAGGSRSAAVDRLARRGAAGALDSSWRTDGAGLPSVDPMRTPPQCLARMLAAVPVRVRPAVRS